MTRAAPRRGWELLLAGARRDTGSASILLLAVGLVIVFTGVGGALVGAALYAQQQARIAADHGALAGALRAVEGETAACSRAAEVAAVNGARLVGCRLEGFELAVQVRTSVELAGRTFPISATARAGPVPPA